MERDCATEAALQLLGLTVTVTDTHRAPPGAYVVARGAYDQPVCWYMRAFNAGPYEWRIASKYCLTPEEVLAHAEKHINSK